MNYCFLLSKDNLNLAKQEIISLSNKKKCLLYGNLLVIDCAPFDFGRLAYAKKVFLPLFETTPNLLSKKILSFNWQKHYSKNFCVRKSGETAFTEKNLASLIISRLKYPKVNLTSPETCFEFIFLKNKVFACKRIMEVKHYFFDRRPHLRPGFSPVSLHPKLARAVVNLTGVKKNQVLLDPFCGTGGILIEAGLVGCRVVGCDLDELMLEKTEENLKFYGIKKYKLKLGDATKIFFKADAVVTDLPYRRASFASQGIKNLYAAFFDNAPNLFKRREGILCVITPSTVKLKHGFRKIFETKIYIHKNLTRKITVLKLSRRGGA
ncbi:methyltransferase domain-containing protein [Candidatus Woesearchaeota archaeon]|nr:methyltransferase domain-containing protein [Candidatus Woesearchaeota archaeon]